MTNPSLIIAAVFLKDEADVLKPLVNGFIAKLALLDGELAELFYDYILCIEYVDEEIVFIWQNDIENIAPELAKACERFFAPHKVIHICLQRLST